MNPILSGLIGPLIDKVASFIPNPEERQKAKIEMEAQVMAQQAEIVKGLIAADLGQMEINKTEAASASMFVAGWRPAIGWICGSALAWQFVLMPFSSYFISVAAIFSDTKIPKIPTLDNSELYPILFAMLGMGGMRTMEKIREVSRSKL